MNRAVARTILLVVLCLPWEVPAFEAVSSDSLRTIKIIHFSDLDGEFASLSCRATEGVAPDFSHFLYLLERERKTCDSIVVSSGNTLADSTFLDFILSQGTSGIATLTKMLRATGAVTFVPGFGEFAIPYRMFLEFLPEFAAGGVPYRAANVTCAEESPACNLLAEHAVSVQELDGLRIAIIPVVGSQVGEVVNPENIKDLSLEVASETVSRLARDLRTRGEADLVIAVVNLETERGGTSRTMDFMGGVEGVDLVLAGGLVRSGESLPVLRSAHSGEKKMLLAGSPRAPAQLGVVTVQVAQKGNAWRIESAKADVRRVGPFRRHTAVAEMLELARSEYCALAGRTLGTGRIEPPMSVPQFTDYVMEVVRRQMATDLAIISYDSIKLGTDEILSGPVVGDTVRKAFARHEIVVLSVSGGDLKKRLSGYLSAASGPGQELAVLGAAKSADGSLTINGRPINVKRRYTISTSDFLASGGRGHLKALLAAPHTRSRRSTYFLQEIAHRHFERDQAFAEGEPRVIGRDRNFRSLWLRPLWDLGLSLAASYDNKTVDNPNAGHSDSQLNQTELTGFKGDGQLLLTMSTRDHKFVEFLRLQYGMTQLGSAGYVETQDLITEELSYAWVSLRNLYGKGKAYVPVPMIKGKLETEFSTGAVGTPSTTAYHHLEVTGVVGVEWQFGDKANAGVAYGLRSELLADDELGGLNNGLQLYYNINTLPLYRWGAGSGLTLDSRFELFYSDWGDENTIKGIGSAKFTATLVGPLSLTAGLDFYMLRNETNGFGYALDTTIGLSLAYDTAFQSY